jgi:hypothetical protein
MTVLGKKTWAIAEVTFPLRVPGLTLSGVRTFLMKNTPALRACSN